MIQPERVGPALAERVSAYKSGYRADERTRIEAGLRSGSLRGVVSTNALELGIDVGYSGSQKCLSCPPGLAPITFSPRAVEAATKRKRKVQS